MTDLRNNILTIIKPNQLTVLATVNTENKPMGRYVMMTGDDDLNLVCVTGLSSRKVKDIKNNSNVHVTMGFNPAKMGPWIHYHGTAVVLNDAETRQKYWDDMLKQYFKGPDDPEYCVICITPTEIEYWAGMQPEIWKP